MWEYQQAHSLFSYYGLQNTSVWPSSRVLWQNHLTVLMWSRTYLRITLPKKCNQIEYCETSLLSATSVDMSTLYLLLLCVHNTDV
jgi:hypothetical protein